MVKTEDVAREYKYARSLGQDDVVEVLHRLLVNGLSERGHAVLIALLNGRSTGMEIAESMGLELNNVDNILSRLHKLGLAEREWSNGHYLWRGVASPFPEG